MPEEVKAKDGEVYKLGDLVEAFGPPISGIPSRHIAAVTSLQPFVLKTAQNIMTFEDALPEQLHIIGRVNDLESYLYPGKIARRGIPAIKHTTHTET